MPEVRAHDAFPTEPDLLRDALGREIVGICSKLHALQPEILESMADEES